MAEDKRRVAVEQRDQADEYRRLVGAAPTGDRQCAGSAPV
jgi:hypothetical protein